MANTPKYTAPGHVSSSSAPIPVVTDTGASMDVKLSQMTTGVTSFFLKALDPIFMKKKKGAVIPIHIGGTREKPSVGLDLKP